MAEPEQELYEELELADDTVEDIYEDLPDSAFNDAPISPPPLPSTPIPSFPSPAHKAPPLPAPNVPPIPTRAVATSLTRNQPSNNLQKPAKQTKATTMKPGKPGKPPPAVKTKAGGGGGGIDISEIMKRARQRTGSTSAIMDLETKIGEKKDNDNAHVAPWANQLRKPKVPPPPKEAGKEVGEGNTPPWVKRKVENEEPATASRAPATAPSKPPVSNGSGPDGRGSPTGDDNKPPWLKQRERQQQLAKTAAGSGNPEKPPVVPKPAAKPPPMAPKPATKPPSLAPGPKPPADQPPPTSPRKVRPVPAPKTNDSAESEKQASGESPPTQSAGVLAKAKMFAEAGSKPAIAPKARPPPVKPHGIGAENSPVVAPRVEKKSPTPPPIPTRESSMLQSTQPRSPSPVPEDTPPSSRPPPSVPETNAAPIPASRPPPISTRPPLPNIPPPPTAPPPPSSQPPTIPPPPPPSEPPGPPSLPDRNPPKAPPPSPPSSRPPPSLPATRAQPTPPTGSVMKFRRRPLKSVDPSKPPPIPPPNSKPVKFPIQPLPSSVPPPAPSGGVSAGSWAETSGDGDEPEDIYEDTVAGALEEDGPDELYDDIGNIQASKPPMPSLAPLPPSVPPPTSRPPMVVETPEMNYETDPNLQQNGVVHDDVTQELYEDLNPDDSHLTSPAVPSVATLPLPPSPSQNSLTPGTSPTLDRKQKLSREQKKQQKEEERKKKEMKKKEEMKAKNRLKSLKTFKEFKLPNDVQSLFGVEVQEDHPKAKDHMAVSKGEQVYVLLINHPKLPNDRYFIEKDDGTMGFVMKSICVRMAYLVQQSEPPPVPDVDEYQDQDIYEQLPADDDDDSLHGIAPPALPPPNTQFLPTRFPAPSQAPPPPPPDEPQDNYEYLPEQEGSY